MTPDPAAVPDGWHRVRLGDLGRFINGRAFKPSDWGQSGLPIVRIQNLTSAEAPFNHYDGEVGDDNLIDTGDIVVSWSASIEARTWDRGPAVLNQHIFKVVERNGVADKRFLFFLLEAATSELRRRVHGTTMQHVTKGTFDSTPALLPPLAEQRAIAAVLDAIDEAIERTEEVIAATERLRDALLHGLLTRGLPGRHSEWVDVPGLGTVPACWEVVRLGEVCEVTSGFAMGPQRAPRDHPRPYLTVANVHTDQVTVDEVRYMEITDAEYASRSLRAGDVVVVEGHAQVSQLGRAAIVPPSAEGFTFQNHLFRVRLLDCGDLGFVSAFINGPRGRAYFASFGGTTSGLNTVSARNVRLLPTPWPSGSEQQAIADALDGVDGTIERAREERAGLHSLQASAADALLTGRVRVAVS